MKKNLLPILTIASIFAFTSNGYSDTNSVPARAEILKSLTFSNDKNLDFGSFTRSGTGDIVISPTNITSPATYSTTITAVGSSTPSAGEVSITGSAGSTIVITLPTSATIQTSDASGSMSITNINSNITTSQVTLTAAPTVLRIGGQLNVPASSTTSPEGLYSGNVQINVSYQ